MRDSDPFEKWASFRQLHAPGGRGFSTDGPSKDDHRWAR